MRNLIMYGAMLTLLFLNSAALAEQATFQTVKCSDGMIVIDGRLDEDVWQKSREHHLKHSLSGLKPTVDTAFRILIDSKNLYFGIVCQQPASSPLRMSVKQRDGAVWRDDCVELDLDPTGTGKEYYRFLVNPAGSLWDAVNFGGKDQDSKWNADGVRVASHVGENMWSVELAIPIVNFLAPQAADVKLNHISATSWRFHVNRECKSAKPGYLTYQPMKSFFEASSFAPLGSMEFDYEEYSWRILKPALQVVRPKGRRYQAEFLASIENLSDRFRLFELTAEADLGRGQSEKLMIAPTFGADAGQTQSLRFQLPVQQGGPVRIRFRVKDKKSDLLVASSEFSTEIDVSPLKLEITDPFYRSAIYATMDVKDIELDLASQWRIRFDKKDRLELIMTDESGKKVAGLQSSQPEGFIGKHRMAIGKLSPGEYTCVARVLRNGKRLYDAKALLHVYGPSKSEVRVNKHLNFVVNGKETFPIGFFHNPWGTPAGEDSNVAILYGPAHDIEGKPERAKWLNDLAEKSRSVMVFPYPHKIWPHQVGGRNELARKPLSAEHARMIADRVSQYQNQPGLFGWYLADEPTTSTFLPAYLQKVTETIRKADPYHPTYISFNFGHRTAPYDKALDAAAVHWYVGFTKRGPVHPLVSVADHMKQTYKCVKYRKPVIYSPQMIIFSHQDDPDMRLIRHLESRCMAYLSIVHGAKGIIWFSVGGLQSGAEIRVGMPMLVQELRKLDYVFLAHDSVPVKVSGKQSKAIHTLAKQVNGQLYIIAVNATNDTVDVNMELPKEWSEVGKVRELASDTKWHRCSKGRLPAAFAPYQVRIFTTDPNAPEVPSYEEVMRRVQAEKQKFYDLGNVCFEGRGATVEVSDGYGKPYYAYALIDGYKDYARESCRHTRKGSWAKITFAKPEKISRIKVSSNDYNIGRIWPGKFRGYLLEVLSDGKWIAVKGQTEEETAGKVFTRIHTFPQVIATAIRLTTSEDSRKVGFANEIQAFSSSRQEEVADNE